MGQVHHVYVAARRGELQPTRRAPGGFVSASVVDPFGNVLGVMYIRHYLEVLEAIHSY